MFPQLLRCSPVTFSSGAPDQSWAVARISPLLCLVHSPRVCCAGVPGLEFSGREGHNSQVFSEVLVISVLEKQEGDLDFSSAYKDDWMENYVCILESVKYGGLYARC